jgi:hypothetical protein
MTAARLRDMLAGYHSHPRGIRWQRAPLSPFRPGSASRHPPAFSPASSPRRRPVTCRARRRSPRLTRADLMAGAVRARPAGAQAGQPGAGGSPAGPRRRAAAARCGAVAGRPRHVRRRARAAPVAAGRAARRRAGTGSARCGTRCAGQHVRRRCRQPPVPASPSPSPRAGQPARVRVPSRRAGPPSP